MGYMHINNLYKDQRVLDGSEVYVLEKVHGTSAHVYWDAVDGIGFFHGGATAETFAKCFDIGALTSKFPSLGYKSITVFGEAYGGKMQRMAHAYGDVLRFIAFDVKVNGDEWLNVPDAAKVVDALGLEFVPWNVSSTKIEELNLYRDAPSVVSERRGIQGPQLREGIVIRPMKEQTDHRGHRVIAKHKGDAFSEVRTPRVVDQEQAKKLEDAKSIADEWVTPMRLEHVLDKIPNAGMEDIPAVIRAMIEDVEREATGEIVESKDARKAIGAATVKLFKRRLVDSLRM